MTVARLLAPAPWGEGLDVDELTQWKVLTIVQNEEKLQEVDGDGGQGIQTKRAQVVTDDGAIASWFETS